MNSLFGGGKDALPMHGGKRDNGVSLSAVNKSVLLSVVWVIFSMFIFYYGFRHSRNYADISILSCDNTLCSLKYQNQTGSETLEILRGDIKSADLVRHDGTEVVDVSGMKRRQANKMGYTVLIKVMQAPEQGSRLKVQKNILLYRNDMGRGYARSASKSLSEYIDRDTESLELKSGSGWTSFGVCCIVLGFFSFIASLLFGQFSDPEPKRLRKIR